MEKPSSMFSLFNSDIVIILVITNSIVQLISLRTTFSLKLTKTFRYNFASAVNQTVF